MLKTRIVLLFISIAAIAIMGGCGTAQQPGAGAQPAEAPAGQAAPAAAEQPAPAEVSDIVWLTTGDMGARPLLDTDRIQEAINEKLGINLQVNVVADGDFTRVNVAMAAGDFPDVVTGQFGSSAARQWVNDGALVPLNNYWDNAPTLRNIMQNDLSWSAVNGNFYGYVFLTGRGVGNVPLSFRQDWLDNLGLEVPYTLDEFYEVIRAFTQDDPDGNGIDDTWALSGTSVNSFDFIFFAHGMPYAEFSVDANGQVIPWHEDPAFRPGMEFLRKIFERGYVDPEFMMNDQSRLEERFYQSRVGFYNGAMFRHVNRVESNLQAVTPEGRLGFSYPPRGPGGHRGMVRGNLGGFITGVTIGSEAREKATNFIDFMISQEGQDLVRLGIEGIHFSRDGDQITYYEDEREIDNFSPNGWAHPLAWGSFFWPLQAAYLPYTEPQRDRALESVAIASAVMVPTMLNTLPDTRVELGSILDDIYAQYFIDMITGRLSIDEGIERLTTEWRRQGGDRVLEEAQAIFDAQ